MSTSASARTQMSLAVTTVRLALDVCGTRDEMKNENGYEIGNGRGIIYLAMWRKSQPNGRHVESSLCAFPLPLSFHPTTFLLPLHLRLFHLNLFFSHQIDGILLGYLSYRSFFFCSKYFSLSSNYYITRYFNFFINYVSLGNLLYKFDLTCLRVLLYFGIRII